jgi:NAD(P)-dependent dehydrogenase (short-subunit alcohol dehydrogenase family)
MAAGSVLITGANGSLAIPSVEYLLSHYPSYTAVLTVRSEEDENSQRLREVISHFPDAKASVRPLDLSSLSAVQAFAVEIAEDISAGEIPPLAAIICNAFTWSISDGVQFTADGHETSFAVNYLAHLSLVLRLLGYFGSDGGRVTFLASDAHYPGKNGLEKYPPSIPEDLDLLVQPPVDVRGEEVGRGFQRYGVSKLAVIMGMYELNRRLARVNYPPSYTIPSKKVTLTFRIPGPNSEQGDGISNGSGWAYRIPLHGYRRAFCLEDSNEGGPWPLATRVEISHPDPAAGEYRSGRPDRDLGGGGISRGEWILRHATERYQLSREQRRGETAKVVDQELGMGRDHRGSDGTQDGLLRMLNRSEDGSHKRDSGDPPIGQCRVQ